MASSDRDELPGAADLRAERLESARYFREQFGLRVDSEHIERLEDRREQHPVSIHEWGVPLTAEELADLTERERVRADLSTVERYVATSGVHSFGGLYIDQARGGIIFVGFTEEVAAHRETLSSIFAHPAWLRVREVDNTQRELDALAHQISADMAEFSLSGVGVDDRANLVEVATPAITADLRAAVADRYEGKPIRLVEGPYPVLLNHYQAQNMPPMIGAVRINRRDRFGLPDGHTCSAGFNVKVIGTPNFFATTAGHCGPPGLSWTHGSGGLFDLYDIGEGGMNSFWNSPVTPADAQRITLRNNHVSNRILTGTNRREITSIEQVADVRVGDPVCRSGWASEVLLGHGVQCGAVTVRAEDVIVLHPVRDEYVLLTNQVRAAVRSCHGDSGGPAYQARVAKGIVSAARTGGASCGQPTTYSHIRRVMNRLNVRVRTNP